MLPLRLRPLLIMLTAAMLAGCQHDEIRTYKVEKPEQTRLLGAILPHGDSTWFFKALGPATIVAAHEAEFTTFLKSLRFSGPDDKPLGWTLPDGWTLEKGNGPSRYATIRIGPKDALELTVTRLGREGQAADVLANVNRWRNQLALPPVTEEELAKTTTKLEVSSETITVVDLTGAGSGKTGVNPPFASGERMPPAVVKEPKSDLTYRTPESWKQAPGDGISKASFEIRDGQRRAKVTITPLPGGAGGLEQNVIHEIPVDGKPGHYVDLTGASRRILAVIVPRGETTWFVKMDGSVDLVGKQKANFEAFVRSLRFDGGPGGKDG